MPTIVRQPSFVSLPVIPLESITPLVELNVGGAPYTVPRAALTRFADSDLARWASGALRPPRDAAGRIFVNRDGAGMQALVSYLRGGMPLSALRDDQLATLQADGEALGLGRKFADTVRWERLRREMEAQPLDLAEAAPTRAVVERALDFLAANAALGLPSPVPDVHALIAAFPALCAEHCAAQLRARPHDRAVLRQAMLVSASNGGAGAVDALGVAAEILERDPYDLDAQICWTQVAQWPAPKHISVPPGGVSKLCAILRRHAPRGAGAALVARLERAPLCSIHADLAQPQHRAAAVETALLLHAVLLAAHQEPKPEREHHDADSAAAWLLRYGLAVYAQGLFVETPASVRGAGSGWFQGRVGAVETLLEYRDSGRSLDARVPLGCFGHEEVAALWATLWRVHGWHGDKRFLSEAVQMLQTFSGPRVAPDLAGLTRREMARVREVLGTLPRGSAEAQRLKQALADELIIST